MEAIEITHNFLVYFSELLLLVGGLAMVGFGVFIKDGAAIKIARSSIFILFAVLFSIIYIMPNAKFSLFDGMYNSDSYVLLGKAIITVSSILVMFLFLGSARLGRTKSFELPILMVFSLLGNMIMISANDFLTLYLGLELQSLPLYVLAASSTNDSKSSEAGLKYFVLGAVASGLVLFGISFIYGFTGTINFSHLYHMDFVKTGPLNIGVIVGLVMVITGFLFKVSAAPFHMWTPDVYQGAPTPITAFFAGAPKVAATILLMRVLYHPFAASQHDWHQIIIFVSLLSILVGALGAIRQNSLKRLMAYSTIGHIGFVLLAISTGSREAVSAVYIYLGIYIVLTVGVFALIMLMNKEKQECDYIPYLAGISQTNPKFSLAMSILMLSLAGIPPLAGFFGKFYIFMAVIRSGMYVPAAIAILASVISAYYYLRVIKVMYFDELRSRDLEVIVERNIVFIAIISTLFNLFFFIYPAKLFDITIAISESIFR